MDLRETDDYLIETIPGAVSIPFTQLMDNLTILSRENPVYLFCYVGERSDTALKALLKEGYEAFALDGGYASYRAFSDAQSAQVPNEEERFDVSEPIEVDAIGLKCPGPIIKVSDTLRGLPYGARVSVKATEDAFASDISIWCERTGNRLLSLEAGGGIIEALIEKTQKAGVMGMSTPGDDKTMVIFSGDLDKTIAAFIIANGAAAMGRKVTLFFTFWGLNILRRPQKVSVAKSAIEKMFGFMMPRGTRKLGLSRMNMAGIGPKMIRSIMKDKGILSLEDLIDQALEHGVRLVACQMSMDIMGIHKEELIDGIELGGVSTFIGSGETSDMSLFI